MSGIGLICHDGLYIKKSYVSIKLIFKLDDILTKKIESINIWIE